MASQKEESVPRVATPTALDTPRQCDQSSMPRASDELDAVYESLVLQGKLDAELDLGRPSELEGHDAFARRHDIERTPKSCNRRHQLLKFLMNELHGKLCLRNLH
eukprot:CAMPEP_0181205516 /NCGR_PEP_ID=MMETSP1096-20121128/20520_1 /TAXON_ID=156174 ORGANISM="Chrysochromulina ericina, Strain CCMP281" /NCGR_SAMPLE_ID=MMETSP1096 /ASSEMBLY_ACC=CAM_ASM_000453 /LENGTH=104 /DNA_ID=CAMNT_0023296307 /DNA_START=204 /DNA_END=515 /DNA_ORIENTATION=+